MKKLVKILAGLLFFCLLFPVGAGAEARAAAPEVELLLYEDNPWLTVIGSDSPILACYTDGLLIFLDRAASGKHEAVYKSARLDADDMAQLRSMTKSLDGLNKFYELSHATDQVTTAIVFRSKDALKQVSAYGGVVPEMRQFIAFFNNLQSSTDARIVPWRPDFLEIMVWPFDHARGEPTPWPEEFPGLDSPLTVKRRTDSYSIYLPIAEEGAFWNFMKSRDGNAVLIDGRKWAVSARIPFPHEIPADIAMVKTPASQGR